MRPDFAWLALAPLGLLAFSLYLHFAVGDRLDRCPGGVRAADRRSLQRRLGRGSRGRRGNGDIADGTYAGTHAHLNLIGLAFFAFALVGGIGALHVLPVAYGVWVFVSLLPLLMSRAPSTSLWSSPRFVAVLLLWLAVVCERRGATTAAVAVSTAGMAAFTAQFALWSFVA